RPRPKPIAPAAAVSRSVSSRPRMIDSAKNHCATTPHSQRGLVTKEYSTTSTARPTRSASTSRPGCLAGTTRRWERSSAGGSGARGGVADAPAAEGSADGPALDGCGRGDEVSCRLDADAGGRHAAPYGGRRSGAWEKPEYETRCQP